MIKPNENQILSEEKRNGMKKELQPLFTKMLEILHFDPNDPQLKDTPERMAKMYVDELFIGCYTPEPKITMFPGDGTHPNFRTPVFLGGIDLKSMCSHHFLPFTGKVYISYIPGDQVVGISKLSRIVKWFMRRPQIQEEFTEQLCTYLSKVLKSQAIIVYCEASHTCMTIRGVEEPLGSTMGTIAYNGKFCNDSILRDEFFKQVERCKI